MFLRDVTTSASNLFISQKWKKTHADCALSQRLRTNGKYLFWVAAPLKHSAQILLAYMHQPGYKCFDWTPTPTFILLYILLMYQSTTDLFLKMVQALKIIVAVMHIYPLYHMRFHPITPLLQPRLLFLSCISTIW